MSMCASSATNVPSCISQSGLISASTMSLSTKSWASRRTIGVRRCSGLPVTPVCAMHSFATKSEIGMRLEMCARPTWSGCFSATSSMSMPPMSLKRITGFFAVPSQTTPA